jgi:hypothetical protein
MVGAIQFSFIAAILSTAALLLQQPTLFVRIVYSVRFLFALVACAVAPKNCVQKFVQIKKSALPLPTPAIPSRRFKHKAFRLGLKSTA